MGILLIMLFYLGASYGLAYWVSLRAPTLSPALVLINRGLALALLAGGLYAMTQLGVGWFRSGVASVLVAVGLWTLPSRRSWGATPSQPQAQVQGQTQTRMPIQAQAYDWRQRLQGHRPWLMGLLVLWLLGMAGVTWQEHRVAMRAKVMAAADAEAARAADEPVFYALGPRPASAAEGATAVPPSPVQGRSAPPQKPTQTWRLVEKFFPQERQADADNPRVPVPPAAASGPARPGAVAVPGQPAGVTQSRSTGPGATGSAMSRSAPAGVNPAVINAMLARAEALLREGRRQEAAAVAGNVLAFDPGNAAARRIREAAGGAWGQR